MRSAAQKPADSPSEFGMGFPRFQPAGDSAVLITFSDQINLAVNQRILRLAQRLRASPQRGLVEVVEGYITLMITYDPLELNYAAVENLLQQLLDEREEGLPNPHRVEIPVIYGGMHGPDLAFVAEHNQLSIEDVIRLHAGRDYPVYMMGFMPGFPYLGGMDPQIAAPRLETPRSRVPAGSVGIAGEQTGIYPLDSPGGWRLIGRTPLRLFDPSREPPFLLNPGDVIQFVPIDEGQV